LEVGLHSHFLHHAVRNFGFKGMYPGNRRSVTNRDLKLVASSAKFRLSTFLAKSPDFSAAEAGGGKIAHSRKCHLHRGFRVHPELRVKLARLLRRGVGIPPHRTRAQ
jgi:hypothetical protein